MKEIRFLLIVLFVCIVSVFLTGCAGISSRAASKSEETTEGSSPTIPSEGTVSEGSESSSGYNPAVEEGAPKEAPPEAEKAKESDMSSATKGDMLDEFSPSEKDFEMSLGGSDATKTLGKALEKKAPGESGLKAGYADDNKQYGYFVNFLAQYAQM